MLNLDNWKLIGIKEIEPEAWKALRSNSNSIIAAGPGAGKTEFLAQKALYLLQTGLCSYPQRILAISFKKDAAKNLGDRVLLRGNKEQSNRFDSMTYDAFAKSIVDKFISCIPIEWRPHPDYKVDSLNRDQLVSLRFSKDFEKDWLSWRKINYAISLQPDDHKILEKLWDELNVKDSQAQLTYVMINRLAECILRLTPSVLQALQITYPYVFMDEFQDTTNSQYDLIKTAFHKSTSILTAVGDDKQKIMLWAGALPNAFNSFYQEFNALSFTLIFNHRSRPELVKIQNVIAKSLNPDISEVQSKSSVSIDGDFAGIWQFKNQEQEAEFIASWIDNDMKKNKLKPKDYCLLTRQKTNEVECELLKYFRAKNMFIRNESKDIKGILVQDMLSEVITHIVINFLKVIINNNEPSSLIYLYDTYDFINNINNEHEQAIRKNHTVLDIFIKEQFQALEVMPSKESITNILLNLLKFLKKDKIKSSYSQYSLGHALKNNLNALNFFMLEHLEENISWKNWLDKVTGEDQIPLMTIHKSKGLEFHTVLFLRLDDEQWWSYSPTNPHEGRATFFVALSRAKQRVFFTYSINKNNHKVNELYGLLAEAKIKIRDFT